MTNRILVIDCGSSKVPHFAERLAGFDQPSDTVSIEVLDTIELNQYAGIIISGAPILLTETDPQPYLEKLKFVTNHTQPILGVCFGHQIIGMLHEAKVSRCKECRTDLNIKKISESELWQGIDDYSFNQDHCEAIDLPLNWKLLASSKICTNEAMQHPFKPIYGVQFHPETSGSNGTQLLKNFCISCHTPN